MNKQIVLMIIVVILGAGVCYSLLSKTADSRIKERSIICFGDSITEGNRFFKKTTYPYLLGKLLGEPVINEGIWGETSSQALQRIKRDVLDKNPRLVIVQFGGNDLSRQIPHHVTMANNDAMVKQIIEVDAVPVILIGASMMLEPKYLNGFREIAKRRNVLLIDNAIDDIIKDPKLTSDGLHPTAQGNEIMARAVYEALQSL